MGTGPDTATHPGLRHRHASRTPAMAPTSRLRRRTARWP